MKKWTKTNKVEKCIQEARNMILKMHWIKVTDITLFESGCYDKEDIMKNLTKHFYLLRKITGSPKINLRDMNKEEAKGFLINTNYIVDKDAKHFELIYDILLSDNYPSIDEIIEELWSLCPDVESLPKYIQVSKGKLKDTLETTYDEDYYRMSNLLFGDSKLTNTLKEFVNDGVLNEMEKDYILTKISQIAKFLNLFVDIIKSEYDNLLKQSGGISETKPKPKQRDKKFEDYLDCENKEDVLSKLHKKLNENTSGKEVAFILEALEKLGYYIHNRCSMPEIVKYFKINCSTTSINEYYHKFSDKDRPEKEKYINLFR